MIEFYPKFSTLAFPLDFTLHWFARPASYIVPFWGPHGAHNCLEPRRVVEFARSSTLPHHAIYFELGIACNLGQFLSCSYNNDTAKDYRVLYMSAALLTQQCQFGLS